MLLTWVEPVSTVITAASLVSEIAKASSGIRKHWSRILYWVQNGSLTIPIFGAGGVGKSTLSQIIAGSDPLDVVAPYSESWITETVELTGNIPGRILVAPGQEQRIERHWPKLFTAVNTGKAVGVVNVVSYGFHSMGIQSVQEHDIWKTGMSYEDFVQDYTGFRRQREVDTLETLLQGLPSVEKPLWMLTIVNKQDLWWTSREAVKQHYTTGEYAKKISDFSAKIGARQFQHEFLPVSLTLGNFCSGEGSVLSPTCPGYDHNLHLRYMSQLFRRIYELGVTDEERT